MFLTRNIKDYIRNKHIYYIWETYATNVNLTNLKVIIFPIPLYLMVYSALFTLLISTALIRGLVVSGRLLFWGSRVRAPAEPIFMLVWFYFYWWIVLTELFRYILKLILNYYFKFERNLSWILLPQELPWTDERISFVGWNIAVINFARCTKPSQLGIEFYLVV